MSRRQSRRFCGQTRLDRYTPGGITPLQVELGDIMPRAGSYGNPAPEKLGLISFPQQTRFHSTPVPGLEGTCVTQVPDHSHSQRSRRLHELLNGTRTFHGLEGEARPGRAFYENVRRATERYTLVKMNPLWRPSSVIAALAAIGALILPLPTPVKLPLFMLAALAWVASVAIASMSGRGTSESPHAAELSPESRMLLRPLTTARDDLAQIVEHNQDMPTVKVIGGEAIQEADTIIEHATKLLGLRTQLKKTLRGKSEAEVERGKLESKLAAADSDTERAALRAAIEATRQQGSHFDQVERAVSQIDAKMTEAQAALSELKARIAVGAAGARTESMEEEQLNDMVGRLKSLSASFDEAETTLQEHVR